MNGMGQSFLLSRGNGQYPYSTHGPAAPSLPTFLEIWGPPPHLLLWVPACTKLLISVSCLLQLVSSFCPISTQIWNSLLLCNPTKLCEHKSLAVSRVVLQVWGHGGSKRQRARHHITAQQTRHKSNPSQTWFISGSLGDLVKIQIWIPCDWGGAWDFAFFF